DGEAAISHRIAADPAGGGAVGADADQIAVTAVVAEAAAETVAHEQAAEAAAHEATEPRPMVARTMAVTVAGATARATVRSPFGVAEVAGGGSRKGVLGIVESHRHRLESGAQRRYRRGIRGVGACGHHPDG